MSNFPPYKKANTADLIPYQNNARVHSQEQIAQIARSILEFGFTNPIIIDGKNAIIAGHGRWLAAKSLGIEVVPTVALMNLTDEQKRAYILADNQLALNAGWDIDLLKIEIESLMGADFDISVLGFDESQLSDILDDGEGLDVGLTDEDELPGASMTPITAPGDVWLMGKHRLVCGDPLSVTAWDQAIVDGAGDLFLVGSDEKTKPGVLGELLAGVIGCMVVKCKELAPGYVCLSWPVQHVIEQAVIAAGAEVKTCIVWDRGRPARSKEDYRPQYECLFYVNGGQWYGRKRESDLWLLDGAEIDYAKNKTQKPVALYERLLSNSTKRGDVVVSALDEYGTLFVACEKLKRRAFGVEANPVNCDKTVERWQNFTGLAALLESDGETYESKKGR